MEVTSMSSEVQTTVEFIPTVALDEEDIATIIRGAKLAGEDVQQFVDGLARGQMMVWRVTTEKGRGLFIISERIHNGEPEIVMELMAKSETSAENRLKIVGDQALATLEYFAALRGAKRIRAWQIPLLFELIAEPRGFKVARYEVVKEL
jgi:hypothetical protein